MRKDLTDDPARDATALPFRFGDWLVVPDCYELRRGEEVRRLQPRLVALLQCLLQAGGRTVSREDLLTRVWRRRMVNDEVLSRAVADLRRALDDDARQPVLIETVPKLGYRACAPMRLPEPRSPGDQEPAINDGAGRRDRNRLDVLPAAGLAALLSLVVLAILGGWWFSREDAGRDWPPVPTPGDFVRMRPLVGDPGFSQTPRFSRQGDLIAYSAVDPEARTARLRIRSRDGRVDRGIDNDGAWDVCPLFSHDGIDVFWTRHGDDRCRLMRIALAGGPAQELAACAAGVLSCPDLDRDGASIVFTGETQSGQPPALARLWLADGRLVPFAREGGRSDRDTEPRQSPDGRHWSWLRGGSSYRQIVLADTEGGSQRVLPFPDARLFGQTWLDSRHLLLATDSEGSRALVRLDIETAERTLLGGPGARFPDRAADGALVWEVAHYQANLWWSDRAGERQLTHHRRSDGSPELSPDGRTIAYQSNREGLDGIWLFDHELGEERRLPLPVDAAWAYPAWTADGAGLVLTRFTPEGSSLWRYRLTAAAVVPVEGIEGDAYDGQESADGHGLWFLREDADGVRRLWRYEEATRTSEAPIEGSILSYRSYGGGIYFQRPDSLQLWRCDAVGGNCQALPFELALDGPSTWTLAGDAVYYQQLDGDGQARVARRRLAGSAAVETLPWTLEAIRPRALSVLPDGSGAVIQRGRLNQLELYWLPPGNDTAQR